MQYDLVKYTALAVMWSHAEFKILAIPHNSEISKYTLPIKPTNHVEGGGKEKANIKSNIKFISRQHKPFMSRGISMYSILHSLKIHFLWIMETVYDAIFYI